MFVCARGWSVTYSNGQRTIPGMSEREGWRGGRGTPPPLCEVATVDGGSVVPTRTTAFANSDPKGYKHRKQTHKESLQEIMYQRFYPPLAHKYLTPPPIESPIRPLANSSGGPK